MGRSGRRSEAQPCAFQHGAVGAQSGVFGCEKAISKENRVGSAVKAEKLLPRAHLGPSGAQADEGLGHQDSANGNHPSRFQRGDWLLALQRGPRHGNQAVYGQALRVGRKALELVNQGGAIILCLAHAQNAAGADRKPRLADILQGLQAVLVFSGGDDFGIKLRGGVEVVVVSVKPRLFQLFGLI